MGDLNIHGFSRLERVTGEVSSHKLSKKELAMLKGAGNVNALVAGGMFPSTRATTSKEEQNTFRSDGIHNPEKEKAQTVADTFLSRSKKV